MKKLLIASAIVAAGALCLQDVSSGHGGTYRGPGDTVPPGGGGGGGAPGAPGTGGPSTPGPSGPTTPGPAAPGAPIGGGPAAATTSSGAESGPDLTIWQFWWGFNREPYLNLKSHIHSGAVQTGSGEFFLGRGEAQEARDALRPAEQVIRGKVVPALLKALNSEQSNDIVTGCLIALAKIGDAKTESGDGKSQMAFEIRKHLTSSSQEIQETAAVALGILANEDKDNVALLEALLFNDAAKLRTFDISYNGAVPDRTRAFAAYGLGLIGYKASDETRQAIVSAMIRMLEGEAKSFGTRDIPVACLTAIGLTPLQLSEASAAAVELGTPTPRPAQVTNRQEQILWLLSYFESAEQAFFNRAHVPIAIARLLADTGNDYWLRQQVGQRFSEQIGKHSTAENEIKQSCILALGKIGDCDDDPADKAIRAALMAVTDDVSDEQSKYFSMIALAQASGRPGSGEGGPLAGLEGKGNPRAFLAEKLAKGKPATANWAALAVAVLERSLDDNKQPSSLDSKGNLRAALESAKAPDEIGALAIAVGIARVQEAKDALRDKFEKISEPEARGFAAIGLGLMDDRGAIPLITEVVKKSKFQPDLLKSAATGLGLLGDKEIVPELISMLSTASGLSSQAAISSALGTIGDSRSVDPLIAMLEDKQKTDRARGFAAVALGIVADKEELPWNAKISIDTNYRANTTTLTSPEAGTGILDIL